MQAKGIVVKPEIMVPLVGNINELRHQTDIVKKTMNDIFEERGETVEVLIGTMIEVPRAAITAD